MPDIIESTSWHQAWVEALDALEQDVTQAERLLRGHEVPPAEPWAPPTMHGPLPQDLVPRARLLLDRQTTVAKDIAGAMLMTGKQQTVAGRLARPAGPPSPVYLDLRL